MKEARAIHAAGRVVEAAYEPPVLRGKLTEGGRTFSAGLRIRNPIDIENLCPCRDSRVRGIICAHSVAVALQVLKPAPTRSPSSSAAASSSAAPSSHPPATGHAAAPSREAAATTDETPAIRLTLEGSLRHLEADISFSYSRPGISNPPREAAALARLLAAGFQEYKGRAALQGESAVIAFFASTLPRLRQDWHVTEGDRFRHVTRDLVRIEPHFALREKEDGWLDFHIHYTAGKDAVLSPADLKKLLQSGSGHLKLRDGRTAIADPALDDDLEHVLRDCDPRQEHGAYRIPAAQRGYIEATVARWKGADPSASATAEHPLTPDHLGPLRAKLRPYQIDGALWLLKKARSALGGLLADEMGLGKTVQTLALIEALPAQSGPVLVVCPSSLVWNWHREAARFLPGLPVLTLDGPAREKLFPQIPRHRLAITSYALLRRDIDHYRSLDFAAVILDEAQHIKNPDSQNARAACALRASSRFILTGTPIENSLRDLWSLFQFLLPGYLGRKDDFKDAYETPLLNGERGPTWERLTRRISPYLLRRRKHDILTELPDKIEQVIEVELTPAQKTAYTQLQQAARQQLDSLRETSANTGAAKMKVLTALLRLRQASCDLRLLGAAAHTAPTASGTASGKITALMELLEETIDGGHRTLVFSQFTTMLDLIGQELTAAAIPYCRLDGSTRDRQAVVDQFQTGTVPVFLISLKAGGTGLNLTAADTVIHFDPWWNPAVEAQATDRAHRIGQKNVVTSIKLIARDTVEERVLKMQEKKRELLEGTVDADAALSRMDDADLSELVG